MMSVTENSPRWELGTDLDGCDHGEANAGVAACRLDEDALAWDEFALLFGDVDHALGHTVFYRAADVHELDFAIYVAYVLDRDDIRDMKVKHT
jgi:hypothetical protein